LFVVSAISVKLKGEAEVKWEEEKRHSTDSTSTNLTQVLDPSNADVYSSEEVYFENKVNLFGGGKYISIPMPADACPYRVILSIKIYLSV
jgi:hypothetical protein